ncbi:MAG: hypothetical protein IT378_22135 [Sandaracinaceae bacterium]|nr:hypothetical protein [Sandaracinaceae bacterium]
MTGLWRSPSGQVFVSDFQSKMFWARDSSTPAAPWASADLPARMEGVFGLSDQEVYAFGRQGGAAHFFRFDGASWNPLPAPPLPVIALHGIAPDLLFAVGDEGMLARWDGAKWSRLDTGSRRVLSRVFVVSADEVYATGHGRELFVASVYGAQRALEHTHPLHGVAKWGERVWVLAGGDLGLSVFENGALVSIKPKLKGTWIEAGESLLVTTPEMVASTSNGVDFKAKTVQGLKNALEASGPPLWRR